MPGDQRVCFHVMSAQKTYIIVRRRLYVQLLRRLIVMRRTSGIAQHITVCNIIPVEQVFSEIQIFFQIQIFLKFDQDVVTENCLIYSQKKKQKSVYNASIGTCHVLAKCDRSSLNSL